MLQGKQCGSSRPVSACLLPAWLKVQGILEMTDDTKDARLAHADYNLSPCSPVGVLAPSEQFSCILSSCN
jgi:hypothetical protein